MAYSYSKAIIIGGGPAGSSAAIYLRRCGFDVCLIEKKPFPRETLCGEFMSIEVVNAIKELNLFHQFLELKPNKINTFRFFNSNSKDIYSHFSFDAYGVKRSTFDNLLLTAAKNAGVEVLQPYEAASIKHHRNKFTVEIRNQSGEKKEISADILIGAYGKQNMLDKNLEREFVNHRSGLNGVKFHLPKNSLNNFNKEEIHIYASDGIYCGVNAVNDNAVTFCFLQNRRIVKDSPKEQIFNMIKENSAFSSLFGDNTSLLPDRLDIYGTGNIYFGKKKSTAKNIFLIGDAAGIIAPLAGDGIGMALESSKLLAGVLLDCKQGDISLSGALQRYNDEWEQLFSSRLRIALLIQKIVLNKYLRYAGFRTSSLFPSLIEKAIKATRTL